ncbi:hypothetical protein Q3V30_12915 [Erwinia pyri]|uniref:Uncharacterized protein n=1 Tax=Erwinia pyri TaxID=3062598 RepID=A0AA50DJL0_9GAMM|nr:hypothetical protein [Erwinia sp. DE2]WLS77386.1 hypothetical protein Q3V30_12915 [Erwinia sp. DE2]
MIINLIMALALALAVVSYWVLCRRRALKYQAIAADILEKYFADRSVTDADKDSMLLNYKISRRWYSLPFFALITPFLLAYMIVTKGKIDSKPKVKSNQKLYDAGFDQCLKMAISKNPILSILSMAFIGVCFAIAIPVGLIFNRLSSLPTPAGIANLFSIISSHKSKRIHLH